MGYRRTLAAQFVCPQPRSGGCGACSCEKRCFLGVLDAGLRARVDAARVVRLFKCNHILFSPGDAPQGLTIVCKGSVRMVFTTEQGKQVTAGYASCGEFIGEAAYLTGAPHAFTAEVLGDTVATFLPKALVDELLSRSPRLLRRLAEDSAGRFCSMARLASNWLLKSADAKLAEFLLAGHAAGGDGLPCMPGLRLTRQDVAQYVGLAPETVIRRLSAFKRRGLVRLDGRFVRIVDRPALQSVAGDGVPTAYRLFSR
ncbi:MAG: Crp/Fnr family transcriptional regulator [Elusimicrobia bacterium]|nr:Crp/Fnr family transcriptional regulator [Elusimicrobiota bacterium]